ncbi:hypothetical protein DL96DRAFT_1691520 [Flagelloscypha sp. PMI_526]|nr:hypothetical protein DL96DRAFT_1691520 [Flagelloscypha sp. PMI_526]
MSILSSRQSALLLQTKEDVEYQQLLADHKALLQRMAQNRYRWNSEALVSQLPPEIMVEIFLFVRDHSLWEKRIRSNFRWTKGCTDVCVRWRTAALSAPVLWTDVFATTRGDPKEEEKMYENPDEEEQILTVLSRSGNADFCLDCRSKSGPSSDRTLILLSQYMERVTALDWEGETRKLWTLFQGSKPHRPDQAIVPAHKLRTLIFRYKNVEFLGLFFIIRAAPLLQNIYLISWESLRFQFFPTEVLCFPAIQQLALVAQSGRIGEWPSADPIKGFLRFFPNLQSLLIGGRYLDGWSHFSRQTDSSQLPLDHLATLCVHSNHIRTMCKFLSILDLPRCATIEIRNLYAYSSTSELNPLFSLCMSTLCAGSTLRVETISDARRISMTNIKRSILGGKERGLDGIERLEIRDIYIDLTLFMPAKKVTTLVLHNVAIRGLFSVLSGETPSQIIFPALQTLSLGGTSTMFARVPGADFKTALAGRSSHKFPVHRLIIDDPVEPDEKYHMLLQLQHIQELVLKGILHKVDEGGNKKQSDSRSDSNVGNDKFHADEGEITFGQRALHLANDEWLLSKEWWIGSEDEDI